MEMTGHILLVCGLAALVSMTTDAINCYECNTKATPDVICTNPFNAAFTKTCSGVSCYWASTNKDEPKKKEIERGCRNDSDLGQRQTKVNKRQATECRCNDTDYCNDVDICCSASTSFSVSLGLRAGALLFILSLF